MSGRLRGVAGGLPLRGLAVSVGSSFGRLVVQMGQFILVARALGPTDYGVFVALVGLCAAVSNLATWGGGIIYTRLAVQAPAGDEDARRGRLALALALWAPASLAVGAMVLAGYLLAFDERLGTGATALVVAADLVFGALVLLATRVLLAEDRFAAMACVEMAFALSRLAAALAFVWLGGSAAADWALWYCAASFAAGVVAFAQISGWTALGTRPAAFDRAFVTGFVYAAGSTAQMARRNLDRPLALAALGAEATGVFGAAARFVEAALMPLFSIMRVAQRRFFGAGDLGGPALRRFVLQITPLVAGVGILIGLSLGALALVVETLLGPAYAGAGAILAAMALMPCVNGLMSLAGDALVAAGRERLRLGVEFAACGIKVAACLGLGASFGLWGFIAGLVASDLAAAAIMWALAFRASRSVGP